MSIAKFDTEPIAEPAPTTARDEIKALGRIAAILDSVDPACRDRIAGWVYDRYRQPAEEVRDGRPGPA